MARKRAHARQKQHPKKERYSDAIIIEALDKSAGLVTHAAARLGCNRATIYRRIERSKKVREALEDIENKNLDIAEAQLMTAIRNGNLTATIFLLKTRGKKRGYSERVDVVGDHKHEHEHEHTWIDDAAAEFDAGMDQFFARMRSTPSVGPASNQTKRSH